MGRIKIVSDGTPKGTHVTDLETGARIQGVRSATWHCAIGQAAALVTLEVVAGEVELTGESLEAVMRDLMDIARELGSP